MKDKKYLIFALIFAVLAGLTLFREPLAKAGIGAFGLGYFSQPANNNGAVATGTLNYLSIGAGTTTVTVNTAGTDQLEVSVFGIASSSALTDLRWRIEYSHSTSTVASQQLWFPEPIELRANATTTTITRTAREYMYRMASTTPHRTGTSTAMNGTFDEDTTFAFSFKIKDIAARWTRIIFYVPTGASTANDNRMDTLAESTAFDLTPVATSTNVGIGVFITPKEPL